MKVGMRSRPYSGDSWSEIGRMITITAYDGTARPMLAMLIAAVAPRPVWPMYSPIGSAIAVAAATETRADREVLEQPERDPGLALPGGGGRSARR